MRYMGNKNRISKFILPTMLSVRGDRPWVEPFCGACGTLDKISGNRYGNDVNPYLIDLFKSLQLGWIPPQVVSKEEYYGVKHNIASTPNNYVAFIGFGCSFGGKWFGGYAFDSKLTNYAKQASISLLKQAPKLIGVNFSCGDYRDMYIPQNSLIYCDPPYAKTTRYKNTFDSDSFWKWCNKKVEEGNIVFVSEYYAPQDWRCVLEIPHKTTMNKNNQDIRVEKLFTKDMV